MISKRKNSNRSKRKSRFKWLNKQRAYSGRMQIRSLLIMVILISTFVSTLALAIPIHITTIAHAQAQNATTNKQIDKTIASVFKNNKANPITTIEAQLQRFDSHVQNSLTLLEQFKESLASLNLQDRDQLDEDHGQVPSCSVQNDTICYDTVHHVIKEPM